MSDAEQKQVRQSEPKPKVEETSRIEAGIDRLERIRANRQDRLEAGKLRSQKIRSAMEKVLMRVATGAVYAISIVACLYLGVIPTAIIIAAMAWLCCSEFYRMVRQAGRMPNEYWGLTAALAYPLAILLPYTHRTLLVTAIFLLGIAVWYVATPRANIADVAVTAFGPIYTSLAFSCIVYIREFDPGFRGFLLAFGVMGCVWLNDTAAYFIGSRFGKHKLAPRISPNKSVEGFWAGIAAAVFIWLIIGIVGFGPMTIPYALFSGVIVGFTSVVGDLFESRIKRGVGVKDSGDILPGHGGLLDRSDAMLFGGMAAYVLLHIGGVL